MKSNALKLVPLMLVALYASGCNSLRVNYAPAAEPPRLLETQFKNVCGCTKKGIIWDHAGAFGPVPTELRETGDATCINYGFTRAVGYHPKAIGLNGAPIEGGAYLCSGRVQGCPKQ